jgi:outer membrane protein TolC
MSAWSQPRCLPVRWQNGVFAVLLALVPGAARAQQAISLDQSVRLALAMNPSLQAAEEGAKAAQARLGVARSAWAPRVDFVQDFTRGNNPVYVFGTLLTQRRFTAANFTLGSLNTPTPLDNFATRLEGKLMLFDSRRTLLQVREAQKEKSVADWETEQARQDLMLRVVVAYDDVLVADQNVRAAEEALRAAEANSEQVKNVHQAGQVVDSDLLSAQVFLSQIRTRDIQAKNRLALAQLSFSRELGLGLDDLRQPAGTLAERPLAEKTAPEWEQSALEHRPALKMAQLHAQASGDQKSRARAEFGPKLGLFADLERDAATLGGPSGTNWNAGAHVEFNLLAGGADRYRLVEAQAEKRQADRQLEWFESGVRLEVRQAFLDLAAARARAQAARDAVEQARESLRIIQNRYTAGLTTITELLRAQTAQLDIQTDYLAALHDWHVAMARLEHAAGLLTLDSDVIRGSEAP